MILKTHQNKFNLMLDVPIYLVKKENKEYKSTKNKKNLLDIFGFIKTKTAKVTKVTISVNQMHE